MDVARTLPEVSMGVTKPCQSEGLLIAIRIDRFIGEGEPVSAALLAAHARFLVRLGLMAADGRKAAPVSSRLAGLRSALRSV
jgi:hypothetical protein